MTPLSMRMQGVFLVDSEIHLIDFGDRVPGKTPCYYYFGIHRTFR